MLYPPTRHAPQAAPKFALRGAAALAVVVQRGARRGHLRRDAALPRDGVRAVRRRAVHRDRALLRLEGAARAERTAHRKHARRPARDVVGPVLGGARAGLPARRLYGEAARPGAISRRAFGA